MYYKNPITRFILRKNFFKKVKGKLIYYRRKLRKDLFDDIQFICQGKKIETIFDIGANIGFVTYQFQKRFPGAHIYAFEPNPEIFHKLEGSYKAEPNIHVFQIGIGDEVGTLSFNLNANTGTSSFLVSAEYHKLNQAKHLLPPIEVQVDTLDSFAARNGLDTINILKMDIEGYELKALQGAENLLKRQAVDIIYSEVTIVPQYIGQPLFHQITSYLEQKDYHLFNMDSFVGQETFIRQAVLGNATYISKRHRDFLMNRYGLEKCGW